MKTTTLQNLDPRERPSSCRQETPAAIGRQPLPDAHLQVAHAQLRRLLRHHAHVVQVVVDVQHGRRREQQGLARVEVDDGVEDGVEGAVRAGPEGGGAGEVGFEGVEPLGRGEAVHQGHAAEVEQLRRDGGLLGRDDDARGQVALLPDDGEEGVGEGVGGGGVGHELSGCWSA